MVTGMQKLNIPKTNSPKAAIASQLGAQSKATGMQSKNASPSVFLSSRQGVYSATSTYANERNTNAPGYAQRTGIGTGEHLNWKKYNSARIGADRDALNAFRTPTFNNIGNLGYASQSNGASTMDKIMAYGMLAATLGKLGVETANAVKSTKNSEVNDPALKGKEQSQTLNDLKNANDSNTLEAAITKAKSEQEAIPAKINTLNSELTELRGQSNDLKAKSEKAAEDLDKHKKAVSDKSEKVNGLKQKETSYNSLVESLSLQYTEAQASYKTCPNKITIGDKEIDNSAQKNKLKAKMDELKRKLDEAEKELESVKNQLKTEELELKDLENATQGFETAVKDTKEAYDKNIKDIEAKQKEKTQLEADKKELDAEVPKQEARLTKLKEKEDKELPPVNNDVTKLEKTISDLAKTIDGSDGIDKKESKTNDKVNKKQTELDNLKTRQKELNDKKLIRNFDSETHNGIQFKTGYLSDGSKGYVVGGKLVSENEYNQKLQQAKDAENS